jgi:hypothetical protein
LPKHIYGHGWQQKPDENPEREHDPFYFPTIKDCDDCSASSLGLFVIEDFLCRCLTVLQSVRLLYRQHLDSSVHDVSSHDASIKFPPICPLKKTPNTA